VKGNIVAVEATRTTPSPQGALLSKVPEVTVFFWVIKVLCTTVGESAADYLNYNLNLGLTGTSIITGVMLAVALGVQLSRRRYIPGVYWVAVVLISVFGTLVTDNLTDNLGVPLETSTIVFSVLLGLTFTAWYASEKTLSIHSIYTRRREGFYWLAILFTFALGTASGDLMAEALGFGYLLTGIIVAGLIAVTAVAWKLGLHPILAFWIIYILTRPLGASIGDYLSQERAHGGLGLGVALTSFIFLAAILATVAYLSVSKHDANQGNERVAQEAEVLARGGLLQTAISVGLIAILGSAGYATRMASLQADTAGGIPSSSASGSANAAGPLGDLSSFQVITSDTLALLDKGDQAGATARIGDLEYAWDQAVGQLKARDSGAWSQIDGLIDTVLRELRSNNPNATTERAALEALLTGLQ
jgi:uncharacterized membrane-anchored protein